MRYFFRVEYDGERYGGWQSQNNRASVQSTLISAFSTVTRQPCTIVGGGRTDAGVHARGQGAHLDTTANLEPLAVQKSVNAVLPQDIAISQLRPVDEKFHARFSAVQRLYKYYIITEKMPLWHRRAWAIYYPLDWELVRANIPHLLGRHDFTTFCAAGHNATSMLCEVSQASLTQERECLVFTIAADRFLYRMVRSLIGTLVDIGRGKLSGPLSALIAARDRKAAGTTAPAWGLVLQHISYSEV